MRVLVLQKRTIIIIIFVAIAHDRYTPYDNNTRELIPDVWLGARIEWLFRRFILMQHDQTAACGTRAIRVVAGRFVTLDYFLSVNDFLGVILWRFFFFK